jgi:hypothetical protein
MTRYGEVAVSATKRESGVIALKSVSTIKSPVNVCPNGILLVNP